MGTRFFLRAFPVIKKVFNKKSLANASYVDLAGMDEQPRDDEKKIHLANIILMNPDYEIETFKNDYADLRTYCARISIYADHRDEAIRIAHKLTQKASLGNNILPLQDSKGGFLDIDIIDTGDLDSNMSERHHSFFNINRLMVDDLYDLIVTGKRAEERTSRLKQTGNVFRFTILPSSVVMV
jgi:esterase/lipase superfamily enzyme